MKKSAKLLSAVMAGAMVLSMAGCGFQQFHRDNCCCR